MRNKKLRSVVYFVAAAVLLGVLLVAPGMLNSYGLFVGSQVVIFALAGSGLTVLLGWSGQIAMAHAGFFGVGAYGSAYLYDMGIPWLASALIAGAVAVLFGIFIGLPAVRLRGFYLAIATLAFGELMVRLFVTADGITGGIAGKSVKPMVIGGLDHAGSVWYASLALLVGGLVLLTWLSRSRIGRCLRAVRDAEVATGSLGISSTKFKLLAFAISAFVGAIAGALFGQLVSYLTPEIFGTTLLIQFLVLAFVGGITRLSGAVIGAAFVIFSHELLQDIGSGQRLAFGVALVIVVRFLPQGLTSLPEMAARLGRRASRNRAQVGPESGTVRVTEGAS